MAACILLVSMLGVLMVAKSSQAQERIGCFSFNHGNTVLSERIQDRIWSIAACIQQCQTRRATYAGVRYGSNCYCGDNHDHTVNGEQLRDSRCTYNCNDHKRLCGDIDSIVIYSVCNRGRYHNITNDEPYCDESCNCKDDLICLYQNGSCPANCETGWIGDACNIRGAVNQPTTIQSEDEHLASSDGVPEHMTANPTLSMTPCEVCPALLAALCVTSVGLVISIIVNIYLALRLRVARIPDKQSSVNIRATHNSSVGNSNDTQYENMGDIQTETSNYEQLGSRQTNPSTYEELSMAVHTRG